LQADNRASSARQIPLHHPLFSNPTIASTASSGTFCLIGLGVYFGMKQSPWNTSSGPMEQIRPTLMRVTRRRFERVIAFGRFLSAG